MSDRLAAILERKRREVARRLAHRALFDPERAALDRDRPDAARCREALRRPAGAPPRVIAEIKFESPSAGPIRAWRPGEGRRVARGYQAAGASAISVLCDRAGFGGGVLELRRVARQTDLPVLFKEFVLDPLQVDLAAAAGASMVLLLVRALDEDTLGALVARCRARRLVPVVEAADAREVEAAAATGAEVIGVNARDLTTFEVDPGAARRAIEKVPSGRVAVYMSGVSTREDLRALEDGRCDAVLVGTGLMRAPDPGRRLAELLGEAA